MDASQRRCTFQLKETSTRHCRECREGDLQKDAKGSVRSASKQCGIGDKDSDKENLWAGVVGWIGELRCSLDNGSLGNEGNHFPHRSSQVDRNQVDTQISTFWLWPWMEEQKALLCFLNSFRWRRGFLARYCSWEEDQVERQRGTQRLPGWSRELDLECNLLITRTKQRSWQRELQSRCCQKKSHPVTLQFLWTNKPLLRNLSWILSDGCYVQMSRRHEVSKQFESKDLDCGDISEESVHK